ncbi:MAG: PIG-L family deacetylase, partial [Actinomycetota bacterium]|nr:PIG-L family deacetylase [Actinomycetota bacterium]
MGEGVTPEGVLAAEALDGPAWRGRVAVVSPHLDDAVFSLGASIRGAVRRGTRVEVLTVLAGLPDS